MGAAVRRLLTAGAALLGVGLALGCSAVLGIEGDRYLVAADAALEAAPDAGSDVVEAAAPTDPRWACLDAPIPTAADRNVRLAFVFSDAARASGQGFDGPPLPGLTVLPCLPFDTTCANPLAGAVTGDDGIANLTVPGGFRGYYQVTGESFSPHLIFHVAPIGDERAIKPVAGYDVLSTGAALAGVVQQEDRGIVLMSVGNCAELQSSGVTFELSPTEGSKLVYLVNGAPSTSATETDGTASAALFNAAEGNVTISAFVKATGRKIVTRTALVRRGMASYVSMTPDQAPRTPF